MHKENETSKPPFTFPLHTIHFYFAGAADVNAVPVSERPLPILVRPAGWGSLVRDVPYLDLADSLVVSKTGCPVALALPFQLISLLSATGSSFHVFL